MALKVILHAGTPKTGTSSLQLFLHRNREALLDRGILYPAIGVEALPKPKHQWMIQGLIADDPSLFTSTVERALNEARPDTRTLILSSEGLFHHWWDFPAPGREALAALARRLPVSLWVFFREPLGFVSSNYVQMLKNPKRYVPCYGRDLSVEDMLDDAWFARHLDYIGYVRDVEGLLGAGSVRPFRYRSDTIGDVLGALGVEDLEHAALSENRTVGDFGVATLRLLNRGDLDAERKAGAVRLIEQLDELMDGDSRPVTFAAETRNRIRGLAAESVSALRSLYGLDLEVSVDQGVTPVEPAAL